MTTLPTVVFITNRFSSVIETMFACPQLTLTGIVYYPLPGSADRKLMSFVAEHDLPFFHTIQELARSDLPRPDFFAVYSLHKILTAEEIGFPKIATLNLHPSMLPLYKGKNPWQDQFADHVAQSGFTVHKITADIDGGDIVLQKSYKLDYSLPPETIKNNALKEIGGSLFCQAIIDFKSSERSDKSR